MGWEKDLPPGEQLVAGFRPFLEHLVSSDLSPKTIQKHVDPIWAWAGRSSATSTKTPPSEGKTSNGFSLTPSMKKVARCCLALAPRGSEEEQRSFDSTCRKLYQFLSETAR
jgi:hypothetical protein